MNKTIQENFHIIQDELNPLQVKGRLKMKWVDKEILNKVMENYEEAINNIIYPLIKEDWVENEEDNRWLYWLA